MSEPVRGIELTIAYTLLTEGAAGKRVLTPQECADIADLMQRRQTEWHALKSATPPPASVVERDARWQPVSGDVSLRKNGEVAVFEANTMDDASIVHLRFGDSTMMYDRAEWTLEYMGEKAEGAQWFTREQWAARQKDGA